MRYTLLLTVATTVALACADRPSCGLASAAVEHAIARRVSAVEGAEYCQFRRYDAIDDLDGDHQEDLVVTFNVEGVHGGGNHVLSFLLVFLSTRQGSDPFELPVGERGTFWPDGISSDGTNIVLSIQKWVSGDPLCCPSGSGTIAIAVDKVRGLRRIN
jgi:hypothetical protein